MGQQNLTRLLAGLMPTGLFGLSVALAPPAQAAAAAPLTSSERPEVDVATRLAAVRVAVSAAMPQPSAGTAPAEPRAGLQKVWFGNHGWVRPWRWGGGWGNGGWGNWHPWGNF